jgi:hypothetical protein
LYNPCGAALTSRALAPALNQQYQLKVAEPGRQQAGIDMRSNEVTPIRASRVLLLLREQLELQALPVGLVETTVDDRDHGGDQVSRVLAENRADDRPGDAPDGSTEQKREHCVLALSTGNRGATVGEVRRRS